MELRDTFYWRCGDPWPNDATPLPGTRVPADSEGEIYLDFVRSFRKTEPGGIPTKVPSNSRFENARRVDARAWRTAPIPDEAAVFLMFEFPVRIHATTMGHARRYFEAKPDEEEPTCMSSKLPGVGACR